MTRPKITWVEGFEREECVWEVKRLKTIKRDQGKMKKRKVINLDRSRSVKRCRDLKHIKKLSKSYPGSVERCPQLDDLDRSKSYRGAIEHPESFSMDQATIKELSRMR